MNYTYKKGGCPRHRPIDEYKDRGASCSQSIEWGR